MKRDFQQSVNSVLRMVTVWRSMQDRCLNSASEYFHHYGGRGISICDRWLGSQGFANFMQDMGEHPGQGWSIERKDNSKGYSPGNCVWASASTQQRNKRNNRLVEYRGEIYVLSGLCELKDIDLTGVATRLRRGWTVEDAVDTPGLQDWSAYLKVLDRYRKKKLWRKTRKKKRKDEARQSPKFCRQPKKGGELNA